LTYRTANLQSCILYIYSTNIGTEYFKHCIYSPLFRLQNAVCFIILTCLVPVLFTFYIQGIYSPFFPFQNAVCFIILTCLVPVLFIFYLYTGYILSVFSFPKCSLFHNSTLFGSCIIHISFIYRVYTLRFFLSKMQFV